jgi:hypothetical protein
MIFSDYVSIFALTISLLSLIISWRQYMRDRGQIKLDVSLGQDIRSGPGYIVAIVNRGRRPVTIEGIFARVSSGKRYPVFDTRKTLDETETHQVSVPFSGFFKSISSGYYIQAFEVDDTTGKRYVVKTRSLRREVARVLSGNTESIE